MSDLAPNEATKGVTAGNTPRGLSPADPRQSSESGSSPWLARLRQSTAGRAARRRPTAAIAAMGVLLFALVAILAPVLPLADPQAVALTDRLQSPTFGSNGEPRHLLGTDQLGRDVLSRTVYGARISLGLAAITVLLSGTFGATLGLIAGYRGGWLDMVVMRIVDFQMAFPSLLIAIFILYIAGSSIRNLILLLSVITWVGFTRVIRAETLRVRSLTYIEAARAIGCGEPRVIRSHILPQVTPVLIVIAAFDFAVVILAEAGLSYLGLGIQPPTASWGVMIAEGQQFVTTGAWWVFVVPGLAISLTVLLVRLASGWLEAALGS